MRHIHPSIVSRHLATRGNNKILRTPPPHISSSEERLRRLTRRTLAQLRPRRSECTAGQMDGEAGWWTTSGNIGLPPLARVMGVGRQQQHLFFLMCSGGVRSILLFPLVARCLETMAHVCFYVCCSDCVGIGGNVCCVSAVVKDSAVFGHGV